MFSNDRLETRILYWNGRERELQDRKRESYRTLTMDDLQSDLCKIKKILKILDIYLHKVLGLVFVGFVLLVERVKPFVQGVIDAEAHICPITERSGQLT